MSFTPLAAAAILWIAWIVSWIAAAWWAKSTVKRPPGGDESRYRILLLAGAVLLATPDRPGFALYPPNPPLGYAMDAVILLGLAFTWWARIHLGTLWSASVTKKEGHHIIDTGPYALVRHPIYTGLIAAFVGSAIMRGSATAFAGMAILIVSFWTKAKLEERFLRAELGAEAYDAYAARVPMLIPFT